MFVLSVLSMVVVRVYGFDPVTVHSLDGSQCLGQSMSCLRVTPDEVSGHDPVLVCICTKRTMKSTKGMSIFISGSTFTKYSCLLEK